jgi:hypothetical protein
MHQAPISEAPLGKCRENYEATNARKIREGRGLGEFKNYKPWLDIRDVPSLGRSHIDLSATVGRPHHLLSDLEERVFLCADYSPRVIDIREQYPLFPRAETFEIAEEMGIKHPAHAGSSEVLTEDLLLTLVNSSNRFLAIQVKYASELMDEEVLHKLELQRRYFARRGIEWKLVTERDLPIILERNLKWLRPGALEVFPANIAAEFKRKIVESKPSDELFDSIKRAGKFAELQSHEATLLFKRLTWIHEIELDINVPLELSIPISKIGLRLPGKERNHARSA